MIKPTIEEKVAAHPYWSALKSPSDEEFAPIKEIKKTALRFNRGDRFIHPVKGIELIFAYYTKKLNSGMKALTPEKYESFIESEKSRAEKFHKKNPGALREYREKKMSNMSDEELAAYRRRRADQAVALYWKNPEKSRQACKEWREKQGDKFRAYHSMKQNEYRRKKKSDPNFKMIARLRARLKSCFRLSIEGKAANRDIHDQEAAAWLIWLANKMGIGPYPNGNKWHIDHLYPTKHFNLKDKSEQHRFNSPENLQWLTRSENCRKNDQDPTQEMIDRHAEFLAEWRANNPPV